MLANFASLLSCFWVLGTATAAPPYPTQLLPGTRQMAQEVTSWATYRQRHHLAELMATHNVSVWVVSGTEYNEDPARWAIWPRVGVVNCSDPDGWVLDPRRGCLNDQVNGGEITVFTYDGSIRRTTTGDDDWDEAANIIRAALEGAAPGPRLVFNDGSAKFQGALAGAVRGAADALGTAFLQTFAYDPYADGSGTPHPLPLEFVEGRVPQAADPTQHERYVALQQMDRALQAYALSEAVITPGITTTEDVNYYISDLAERILGLRITSSPAVEVFRKGKGPVCPL